MIHPMIPGPHAARTSRAGDIAPLLVDIPTTCRLTGKSRTYIYDHLDQFRSVLIGRTRMIDYQSIREWVDRKLAEAGHAPQSTSPAPAPTMPADLIAAAEAVAMSPRAMGDARALALRVLDLAEQNAEAAR